ncbi:ParB/RepB/Spo0J family partition protein [Vibrio aerogenes]|uniref:ParB/RepB/Spo0J family partition protein n=1 Tax=Vibrio aerogenes TaxID=92172 RepID=UPI0021C411FD|nr:ParB/RepB/Spo0J family partition protein [Vibrio aerogenes]
MRRKISAADLDGLFDESEVRLEDGETIVRIPKSDIYSVAQVRGKFKPEYLNQLQVNIETQGQIEPIIVNAVDSKGYCIQKGECRWRAIMQSEQLTHVDCIIREAGTVMQQLSENMVRADLSPFEIGAGFIRSIEEEGESRKSIGAVFQMSNAVVSSYIKCVDAPEFIKTAYEQGKIGDIDSINALRKAASIDDDYVRQVLSDAETLSRSECQKLHKNLKNPLEPSEAESLQTTAEVEAVQQDEAVSQDSAEKTTPKAKACKTDQAREAGDSVYPEATREKFQILESLFSSGERRVLGTRYLLLIHLCEKTPLPEMEAISHQDSLYFQTEILRTFVGSVDLGNSNAALDSLAKDGFLNKIYIDKNTQEVQQEKKRTNQVYWSLTDKARQLL